MRPPAGRRLLQGLDASVTGNAQAFGFSITVTVTFGVLSARGNPSSAELVGFALSGVLAFSLLNLAVARLLSERGSPSDSTRGMLLGTATDALAVGGAVSSALGVRAATHGLLSWLLAPFVAGIIYVLVQSVELAVGQQESEDESDAG